MDFKAVIIGVILVGGVAAGWGVLTPRSDTAQNFTLYSTKRKAVTLEEYRGKVVVLDFWASWCAPCRMAIPSLQRISEEYAERGVEVIGINVRDTANPVEAMKSMGATYTCLLEGEAVAQMYGVRGIPALFVIDREGKVIYKEAGWGPGVEAGIRGAIEKALGARS